MTRKIIQGNKDSKGAYLPKDVEPAAMTPPAPAPTDDTTSEVSIDDLLATQLRLIKKQTHLLVLEGNTLLSKDNVQKLATLTDLTWEFKKKEKELLDAMDDEDLEAELKK